MYLIPFKDRGFSGSTNDNLFLKLSDTIYLMDNHRLAMWAMMDLFKRNPTESFNFLHIDAHPDLSDTSLNLEANQAIKWGDLSLDEFRNLRDYELNIPLIRWDNYISFVLKYFSKNINGSHTFSATHKMGSDKKLHKDIAPHELLRFMNDYLNERIFYNTQNWIVNVDLDYFFTSQPHKEILFSDGFLNEFTSILQKNLENKRILLLMIALSPECCGSWKKSEDLLYKMFKIKID